MSIVLYIRPFGMIQKYVKEVKDLALIQKRKKDIVKYKSSKFKYITDKHIQEKYDF